MNITPTGLFPNIPDAETNPKCVIVSKIIQELCVTCNMNGITQEDLQKDAQKRYDYISNTTKLPLYAVDRSAFLLYQRGVSTTLVKEYFSYRLNEADAKKWKIVTV